MKQINFSKIISTILMFTLLIPVIPVVNTRASAQENQNAVSGNSMQDFLRVNGRVYYQNDELKLFWTNSGFSFNFKGTGAVIRAASTSSKNSYLNIYIDGALVPDKVICLTNSMAQYILAENLTDDNHTIRVAKRNQANFGATDIVGIKEISLTGENASFSAPSAAYQRQIEFVGDSITCGQGNLRFNTSGAHPDYEDGTMTYAAFTSAAFGAANQTLSQSGIRFVRNDSSIISGTGNSITNHYVQTAMLPNTTGNSENWDFSRQSDVVVINLGTNDSGINAASDVTPVQLAEYFQSEAKALISIVRENNPDAVIIWCYGMMGENEAKVSAPVKAAIRELNDGGDEKIYWKSLSDSVTAIEGKGDGHPTVAGNLNRSYDLIEFISEKTGWDYSLQPQLQTKLYQMKYIDETALEAYTDESAEAFCKSIDYANALVNRTHANDEQIQAATQLVQVSWLSLKEKGIPVKTGAYVNADSALNVNAKVAGVSATTEVTVFEDSPVWKLNNQNHGFGVQVDNDVVGYTGQNFKIEIEYYMPTVEDPPADYSDTRLAFRYNRADTTGVNDSNRLRRTAQSGFTTAETDTWAIWTINLTDAEFRRGVDGSTDFNIIKWTSRNNNDLNGIDFVYIRSITITPLDTDITDKTPLETALDFDEEGYTGTSLNSPNYLAVKEMAQTVKDWDDAPRRLVEFTTSALLAEQRALVLIPDSKRTKSDVNNDNSIDIFDIMSIRDHIFGKSELTGDDFTAADVNGDEDVNIFDIMAIRDHIFGKQLITEYL